MSGSWVERTVTVTVRGLELQVPDDEHGTRRYAGQIAFVPQEDLEALAEQGPWDPQFGQVLLLDDERAATALEAHGLAVHETRGGWHGTDRLRELLVHLAQAEAAGVNQGETPRGTTDHRPQPGAGRAGEAHQ